MIWTGLTFLLTVYQIPKIIGGIMVITLILVKGAPKKGLLIQRSKKVAFVLYFSIILYFISQSIHLQEKQAGFYDNIIKVIRGEPEYFKAAFYGLGFPTFLRVSIKKKNDSPSVASLVFHLKYLRGKRVGGARGER